MSAHRPACWSAPGRPRNWRAPATGTGPVRFHRGLPGYRPTPLVEAPELAAALGVSRLLVKDESSRFGLPAFKILGASWAVEQALAGATGVTTLVAATDGNHGRAVARVAAGRGLAARIFVPAGVHPDAVAAIAAEAAEVTTVSESYDAAVAAAVSAAEAAGCLLVQDTAWPGYEQIPSWIVAGYSTLFAEIDQQLGAITLDLLVVPVGVGSLAQAALAHYRRTGLEQPPAVLAVEPESAPCLLRSLQAGEPVCVPTSPTVMSGLCCETVSSAAWPYLRDGLDAAVAVGDPAVLAAAVELAAAGVPAGPCGAATLAAARLALADPAGPRLAESAESGGSRPAGSAGPRLRERLGITGHSTVVLLSTESSAANPKGMAA